MGTTVTVKGQVTVPKPVRDRLGLVPGSKVEFDVEPDGRVLLRVAGMPRARPDAPAGYKGKPAPGWNGMTTDEVMKLTRGEDWGDTR